MKVDQNTKISKIIKENKKAIDVLASINKNFTKLHNPILRRALAPRVNIREAAKIGGVKANVILQKLQDLGFDVEMTEAIVETPSSQDAPITNITPTITLDVRPDIEEGKDPFQKIMKTVQNLQEGDIIKIINSFEPIPLINQLKNKGFSATVERPQPGLVHTYFQKGSSVSDTPQTKKIDLGSFSDIRQRFGEKIKTVDVRALEMPMPMVTILSEIETLPEGHALYVHHKKFPKFLTSELSDRNFHIVEQFIDANNTKLIIFKL